MDTCPSLKVRNNPNSLIHVGVLTAQILDKQFIMLLLYVFGGLVAVHLQLGCLQFLMTRL